MKTAGMGEIDFDRKFVAIKMHFGEPGNLAFLRPNWAKTVADFVKEAGWQALPHRLQHPVWGDGRMGWIIWIRRVSTASTP